MSLKKERNSKCLYCGLPIPEYKGESYWVYKRRKFCSQRCMGLYRKKPPAILACHNCNKKILRDKTTMNKRKNAIFTFCSRSCRAIFYGKKYKVEWKGKGAVKKTRICWTCNKNYLVCPSKKTHYCSSHCKLTRWSKKYPKCISCKTKYNKYYRYGYCYPCFLKSPEEKIQNRIKNAKRRARMFGQKTTDITNVFLKELWVTTIICVICNLPMANHSKYPNGKHLDHIVPLYLGGTHTKNNVRYIHAICNIHRPENFAGKILPDFQYQVPILPPQGVS